MQEEAYIGGKEPKFIGTKMVISTPSSSMLQPQQGKRLIKSLF